MNHSDMPEGYEPQKIPFQPAQRQDPRQPVSPVQAPPPQKKPVQPARMPKAQALSVVRRLKQGAIVGSLLCFGTVAGLIVNQTNSAQALQTAKSSSQTTTTATTTAATPTSTAVPTSTVVPTATATTTSSNNTTSTASSTSSTQQGGSYGFGSTQASQPVSGSHTS